MAIPSNIFGKLQDEDAQQLTGLISRSRVNPRPPNHVHAFRKYIYPHSEVYNICVYHYALFPDDECAITNILIILEIHE